MGEPKGQLDRYPFPCVRSTKASFFLSLRRLWALGRTNSLALSHDLSYKVNSTLDSVTRNLRNLRPTYELRQHFLYNNQVRCPVPQLWHGSEESRCIWSVLISCPCCPECATRTLSPPVYSSPWV